VARAVGQPGGPFGAALANVVADTVYKVLVAVLPHYQAARAHHGESWAQATHAGIHDLVRPMARAIADSENLHPLLRPVVEFIVKGSK